MNRGISSSIYRHPTRLPLFPNLSLFPPSRLLTSPSALPSHLASTPVTPVYTIADYVPDFPRLGTPIRDFIAKDVPQLPGFNADDFTKLFLPDLIQPSNIYTCVLLLSCAVAFVYLELGALVDDFLQEKDFEKLEDEFLEEAKTGKYRKGLPREEEIIARDPEAELKAKQAYKRAKVQAERKRGLGWLALVTALAVWTTGIIIK